MLLLRYNLEDLGDPRRVTGRVTGSQRAKGPGQKGQGADGPGRLQDFTALYLAAAHLRYVGEQFSQDTDRPFAPQGGLVVALDHHQSIECLKKVVPLSLQNCLSFSPPSIVRPSLPSAPFYRYFSINTRRLETPQLPDETRKS